VQASGLDTVVRAPLIDATNTEQEHSRKPNPPSTQVEGGFMRPEELGVFDHGHALMGLELDLLDFPNSGYGQQGA
jgi:hypothetical protein